MATPRARRNPPLDLQAALWLTAGGQGLAGPDRMALLRAVQAEGSITQAAKAHGISYKAAWAAIDAMNRLAGEPLVARVSGGRGGGSTQLTARGLQLLRRHAELEAAHQGFIERLARQGGDLDAEFSLLEVLSMKTSARNQFRGTVSAIRAGAVNDEVEVRLPSGLRLTAIVTQDSTRELGLRTQRQVLALVPAAHVLLATGLAGARVSARNQLPGTVRSLTPGAVNTEVLLAVAGGGEIVATVTQASVQSLGLVVGGEATALVKATDVILAVVD